MNSAVRTGILIGGPQDGMAVRVTIGQPSVIVPIKKDILVYATYDPATKDAYPSEHMAYDEAVYWLETVTWPNLVVSDLQFYVYSELGSR